MGAGHPDPEIRGRLGLEKNFFRTFGPQFGLKMGVRGGGGGGTGSSGPFPGYATVGYRIGIVFQL